MLKLLGAVSIAFLTVFAGMAAAAIQGCRRSLGRGPIAAI